MLSSLLSKAPSQSKSPVIQRLLGVCPVDISFFGPRWIALRVQRRPVEYLYLEMAGQNLLVSRRHIWTYAQNAFSADDQIDFTSPGRRKRRARTVHSGHCLHMDSSCSTVLKSFLAVEYRVTAFGTCVVGNVDQARLWRGIAANTLPVD
jgi:hypothetical protein